MSAPADIRPMHTVVPPRDGRRRICASSGTTEISSTSSRGVTWPSGTARRDRRRVGGPATGRVRDGARPVPHAVRAHPHRGVPYPVFALTGMGIWLFVTGCLSPPRRARSPAPRSCARCTSRAGDPAGGDLPADRRLLIALVVLFAAMAIFGVAPSATIVALPGMFLLAVLVALGVGLWLGRRGPVPRHPARRPIHRPDRAVPLARLLSARPGPRAVSGDLLPEPGGRGPRGLPLGPPGHRPAGRAPADPARRGGRRCCRRPDGLRALRDDVRR